MTPLPSEALYNPREVARHLGRLCNLLEENNVPAEQVEEMRALAERFTRHFNKLLVFQDQVQDFARRLPTWLH